MRRDNTVFVSKKHIYLIKSYEGSGYGQAIYAPVLFFLNALESVV